MGLSRVTSPSVPRLTNIPTIGLQPVTLVPLNRLKKGDVLVYSTSSASIPWKVEEEIDETGNVLCQSLLTGYYRKINKKILRKDKVYRIVKQWKT